jgi:hypothetical protein
MLEYNVIKKTYLGLLLIVLTLTSISLIAELLPEIEAKIIVVPTLILVIALVLMEFIFYKKNFTGKSVN